MICTNADSSQAKYTFITYIHLHCLEAAEVHLVSLLTSGDFFFFFAAVACGISVISPRTKPGPQQ